MKEKWREARSLVNCWRPLQAETKPSIEHFQGTVSGFPLCLSEFGLSFLTRKKRRTLTGSQAHTKGLP